MTVPAQRSPWEKLSDQEVQDALSRFSPLTHDEDSKPIFVMIFDKPQSTAAKVTVKNCSNQDRGKSYDVKLYIVTPARRDNELLSERTTLTKIEEVVRYIERVKANAALFPK